MEQLRFLDLPLPDLSGLRVMRVLRPLRSLKSSPRLSALVSSMLLSLPQLGSVLVLLFFIFLVFGILGIQLFAGMQHTRCRATPFPVTRAYQDFELLVGPAAALANASDFRCVLPSAADDAFGGGADDDYGNFAALPEAGWFSLRSSKGSSDWATARDCYWPLAPGDGNMRLCTIDNEAARGGGVHHCWANERSTLWGNASWCGASFDARGN